MDCESAKRLKDAGFRFSAICEYAKGHEDGIGSCSQCGRKTFGAGSRVMCLPALEELIEACGYDFFDLERYNTAGAGTYWMCHASDTLEPITGPKVRRKSSCKR
jgi:hypothetical protein